MSDEKPSLFRHVGNESVLWESCAVRLTIYFALGCFPVYLTQTEGVVQWSDWTTQQWSRVIMSSLVGGLVSVKAYLDNSSASEPKPKP